MLSPCCTPPNRAPRAGVRGAENRTGGFCRRPPTRARFLAPQMTKPRRVAKLAATKSASGPTVWPSRDPIEEDGGINLYGYVLNNPINLFDSDGRMPMSAGAAQSMYAQSLASQYSQQAAAAQTVAAYNKTAGAVNCVINKVVNPVYTSPQFRATKGAYSVYSGVSYMIAGGVTAGAGAAATVTIPGVGQVAGPAAVGVGYATMGYGMYSFGNGMYNMAQGLNGQGNEPLPNLPFYQLPPPPAPPGMGGNGCPPKRCP
jgi:hypothetical protein